MAITLHKVPAEINFSNDPIVIGFTTDALNVSAGTQAVNTIEFTTALTADQVLLLTWAGKEIRFQAKASPVLSNEIPTGTIVLATLLPYFRDNFTIQEDFDVLIDTGKLKFTAKKPGPEYNFTAGTFPGGTIAAPVAGIAAVTRENFSVWLEVKVAGSVVYKDFIPVNSDSKAEVDIHESLHSILAPDLPADLANVAKCTKSVKDFSIRYAEVFGAKPQVQRVTTGSTYKVMLGGSSLKNKKTPAQLLGSSAAEDPCLRFGSSIRFVSAEEPQYLYFSALRAAGTYKAKIVVTYTDNTTHTFETGTVVLVKNEKSFFNVGFEALDLASLPKDVKQYTVQIMQGVLPYCKVYTYIIDYGYHRYSRRFGYVTGLGAVDLLTTYGKQSQEMEYFRQQAERVLDETSGDLNQFLDYKIELQEGFQVATGFKSRPEIAFMRDFYLSPQKWRITQNWIPIVVNTQKVLEAKDGNNLYAHSFEYNYAYRDDGFSESDIDSEIMPSPPPGFLSGGQVEINITPGEISFDPVPVANSLKAVRSGGIHAALEAREPAIPSGSTLQFIRGDKTLGNLNTEIIASGDPRYFYNNTFGNTNKPLFTAIVDSTPVASVDPLATDPGHLKLGTVNAQTILIGHAASAAELSGSLLLKSGQLNLAKDVASPGLFWKTGSTVNDQIAPITNGFLFKAQGDSQGVRLKTSAVFSTHPTTFLFPEESSNMTPDELSGFTPINRTLATREWALKTIANPWQIGGNIGGSGDQILGHDHAANLHIQLFGSKVATYTPEGNHLFGYQSGSIIPLAVGHFHANVVGDTEVALFRASNASVSNYFGVSVDPTTNTVLLRNSGTLKVKNGWQFDALANFTVSPTTITATTSSQVPNWGQVQALVSLGFAWGTPVKTVSTTSLTKSGLYAISGYTPAANERVLDASGTTGSGVWITAAGAWTRATTEDTDPEIRNKGYLVTHGSFANTQWANNNSSAITLNTTPITYVQTAAAETDPIFTAHAAHGITSTLIGNWNSAYTLATADYTPLQIDGFINPINTAISGINSKLNSGALTTHRVPRWDGSKFINSQFTHVAGEASVIGPFNLDYLTIRLGTGGTAHDYVIGTGVIPYTVPGSFPPYTEFKYRDIYFEHLNLIIGAGNSNHLRNDKLTVSGNIQVSGLIKTSYIKPLANQFLRVDADEEQMEYVTLGTEHISNLSGYAGFDARYYTELEIDSRFTTLTSGLSAGKVSMWNGTKFTDSVITSSSTSTSFNSGIYIAGGNRKLQIIQSSFYGIEIGSTTLGSDTVYLGLTHNHLPWLTNSFSLNIGSADKKWGSINMYGILKPDGAAPATAQVLWSTSSSAMQWKTLLIEDISDLITTLDGKSNVGHTHTTSNITDWSAAWDSKMTAFIGAAPAALDTWNEFVTALQSEQSATAAINSSITAINTKLNSGALTTHRVPRWDGSKFINSQFTHVAGEASVIGPFNLDYLTIRLGNGGTAQDYVIGTGVIPYTVPGSFPPYTEFKYRDIYFEHLNLIIGAGNSNHLRNDKLTVSGNIQVSGLIKTSYINPGAGQFMRVNSAVDAMEYVSLTEADIIQSHEITNPTAVLFSRELQGLYMSNEGDESFFVGTDITNGKGIFRSKFWKDNAIEVFEHTFDLDDSGRFGRVDSTGTFQGYAFKTEVSDSGGGIPTLQQVVSEDSKLTKKYITFQVSKKNAMDAGIYYNDSLGIERGLISFIHQSAPGVSDAMVISAYNETDLQINSENNVWINGPGTTSVQVGNDLIEKKAAIIRHIGHTVVQQLTITGDTVIRFGGTDYQLSISGTQLIGTPI